MDSIWHSLVGNLAVSALTWRAWLPSTQDAHREFNCLRGVAEDRRLSHSHSPLCAPFLPFRRRFRFTESGRSAQGLASVEKGVESGPMALGATQQEADIQAWKRRRYSDGERPTIFRNIFRKALGSV